MDSAVIAKIIAFVLYLGFMIYIGLRNASKNNNSSDFFLGGRRVGPWVTALSAEASDSSAWLLMGLPGLCYLGGVKETFWTALGLIVGTYLNWLFVAKPLRKCSISFGDSITIPEFFTNRFKDKSHVLSVLSVIFIVFFFTIYTASSPWLPFSSHSIRILRFSVSSLMLGQDSARLSARSFCWPFTGGA